MKGRNNHPNLIQSLNILVDVPSIVLCWRLLLSGTKTVVMMQAAAGMSSARGYVPHAHSSAMLNPAQGSDAGDFLRCRFAGLARVHCFDAAVGGIRPPALVPRVLASSTFAIRRIYASHPSSAWPPSTVDEVGWRVGSSVLASYTRAVACVPWVSCAYVPWRV